MTIDGARVRSLGPVALVLLGGCAVLGATFLHWYLAFGAEGAYLNRSTGGVDWSGVETIWLDGSNGWGALHGLDVALAAFAALAVLTVATRLRPFGSTPRRVPAILTVIAGLGVAGWTLERVFDRPAYVGLGPGPVVALTAVAVTVIGAAVMLVAPYPRREPPAPPAT